MTNSIVNKLKSENEDFEWYPTTDKMIDVIKDDMLNHFFDYSGLYDNKVKISVPVSVLDCGAGDGRVVDSLSNGGKKYAIEKSKTLIDIMPDDVFIVGTDFFQSTLIDKNVKIIFCNPPYSEFNMWAEKIILEANSSMIYMILPKRWKNCEEIKDALKLRKAECKVIYTTDFLNAPRSARATVDILSIRLYENRYSCNNEHSRPKTDPFDLWFEKSFKFDADKVDKSDYQKEQRRKSNLKDKLDKTLVNGKSLVPSLVELYNNELSHLHKMFISISDLDSDILKELNVNVNDLKESLKQRIVGLKNRYWKELFDNYDRVTKRLTHSSRETMLKKLMANTTIDFTESNIYAVTIWVIKNANKYFDSQLIDLVETMVDKANVAMYKSNKRLYTDQDWKSSWGSSKTPDDLKKFGLEYRIVLHNVGGIFNSNIGSYDYPKNLNKRAHNFLDDIIVVAGNLGMNLPSTETSKKADWDSGKKFNFFLNEDEKIFMEVKAFKNGNLHIKFNLDFIRLLNVEFGRLKGWLSNHNQASEELNIPANVAARMFKSNYQLDQKSNGLLALGIQ